MMLVHLKMLFLLEAVLAAAQIHDLNVMDLVKTAGKGGGADGAPTIIWSPSIVVTNANVTVVNADAQWKDSQHRVLRSAALMSRSIDGGHSFSSYQDAGPGSAQMLYSALTDVIYAFGLSVANHSEPVQPVQVLTMSNSTTAGRTWSTPVVLEDPFVVGEGGLGHGIELQRGPHCGRFVLPYAKASSSRDRYQGHALAVYSDDNAASWSVGGLLPDYSGEASLTELSNGSVLITFRMEGEHMQQHPHVRGFARSDDGCETWNDIYYLDTPFIDAPSMQAIDRSEKTGVLYFGHPGSFTDRANYTIHQSTNEGASWDFVGVIYPGGAGYSDVHVLPSEGPGDRLGVAFQRTINQPGVEGGGYNLAWASMTILPDGDEPPPSLPL